MIDFGAEGKADGTDNGKALGEVPAVASTVGQEEEQPHSHTAPRISDPNPDTAIGELHDHLQGDISKGMIHEAINAQVDAIVLPEDDEDEDDDGDEDDDDDVHVPVSSSSDEAEIVPSSGTDSDSDSDSDVAMEDEVDNSDVDADVELGEEEGEADSDDDDDEDD